MKVTNPTSITNIAVYFSAECSCDKDAHNKITMKKVNNEIVDETGMFKEKECGCKSSEEVKQKAKLTETGFYQIDISDADAKAQTQSVSRGSKHLSSQASSSSQSISSADGSSSKQVSSVSTPIAFFCCRWITTNRTKYSTK